MRSRADAAHTISVSERLRIVLWRLGVTLADERGQVDVSVEEIDMLIVRLFEARRKLNGGIREVQPWKQS